MLPHDLPNWSTVHYYSRKWKLDGTWELIESSLREQVRISEGKESTPSLLIADSQSVKTSFVTVEEKGFDGNKRVKGRKRNIVCDTLGLPWAIAVTAANVGDREGILEAIVKLVQITLPRLQKIIFDQGYIGELFLWLVSCLLACKAEVVFRKEKGFHVLEKRWIIERTFAWLLMNRRLACDYEKLASSSEALIRLAMIRLMLKRLHPS